MSEPREPLLDAIHAAGEVPPPPDRSAAFARAMHPVLMPSRRRLNRSFIALFAAALLAVPAAVFAARASHTTPATITPITFEKPDPHSSIQHEADDNTIKRQKASAGGNEQSGSTSQTDDRSGPSGSVSSETEHSGDVAPATDGSDGSGSRDGGISTPAPTPLPSPTSDSDAAPDGIPSGSPDGGSPGPN